MTSVKAQAKKMGCPFTDDRILKRECRAREQREAACDGKRDSPRQLEGGVNLNPADPWQAAGLF